MNSPSTWPRCPLLATTETDSATSESQMNVAFRFQHCDPTWPVCAVRSAGGPPASQPAAFLMFCAPIPQKQLRWRSPLEPSDRERRVSLNPACRDAMPAFTCNGSGGRALTHLHHPSAYELGFSHAGAWKLGDVATSLHFTVQPGLRDRQRQSSGEGPSYAGSCAPIFQSKPAVGSIRQTVSGMMTLPPCS
jgi:hypothetical protein